MCLELHRNGSIKEVFGKSIPVIINELEYYDKPVHWTKKGKPSGIVNEVTDTQPSFSSKSDFI
jgi:hypothetical protein